MLSLVWILSNFFIVLMLRRHDLGNVVDDVVVDVVETVAAALGYDDDDDVVVDFVVEIGAAVWGADNGDAPVRRPLLTREQVRSHAPSDSREKCPRDCILLHRTFQSCPEQMMMVLHGRRRCSGA